MSYQVLARKWRPKSFGTLVGQEHVVRALTHALATGRLHHAWLFTGTRGVGKTTISRILAKALNCETGITPEPCNACSACRAIDADRFPDYVEMDAASNRGVEDMAALLDKAAYAPVQGRFKVFMIDEVHMLTGHAFNAMLKTLEEPPEHVKFILATTDPQKIPVTVLSRCLQFNLKQMPQGRIVDHLSQILQAEGVAFEPGALRHLAKAAAGSMRDALSLLDQAIAHGAGKLEEEQVTHMLGTVGDDHLYAVLDALAAGDVPALLAVADAMEARSLSFDAALQALATLVHRIALAQYAPEAIGDEVERARILGYVERFDAEFLQLAYQIAIHGRDELPLAPDEYTGFTMTLLRLHAFRPEQPAALGGPGVQPGPAGRAREIGAGQGTGQGTGQGSFAGKPAPTGRGAAAAPEVSAPPAVSAPTPAPPAPSVGAGLPANPAPPSASAAPSVGAGLPANPEPAQTRPEPSPARAQSPVDGRPAAPSRASGPAAAVEHDVPPWEDLPAEAYADDDGRPSRSERVPAPEPELSSRPASESWTRAPLVAPVPAEDPAASASTGASGDASVLLALGDWRGLIRALGFGGLVRELAQHCEWVECGDDGLQLRLSVAHRHLLDMNRGAAERIQDQLSTALGRPLKVRIEVGDIASETPAQRDAIERRARHAEAVAALEADPFVRELIERFDATLVESTVKPL
ncbi:DNA polymerase III subunit gamma/tau [Thauera sp.]|jgi:DNA polymerase-3 subunit gamma/tau|uniref:DNA polymerase III subunit gamma/tau n=1 Tax=Thauera sp. TaxID=1905334 RepID=UPI002A3650C2|nr:DNA polymerase III subunit gamma/tau [Thauera sp.]MDX9885124.1 DNA polymerase III subunit gamma/tau [Thauera sp.]